MISHDYKAIFVHIPKSAGTSVGTKLGLYTVENSPWGMQDHRSIRHLHHPGSLTVKQYFSPVFLEIVARRLRDGMMLGKKYPTESELKSYYKFTFVRNSWARVHSWYKNVMNDERHMRSLKIPKDASFHWFVDNRLNSLRDQLYYIKDIDGSIGVDFIGRFETLQDDFNTVCNTLGISDTTLPERNISAVQGYVEHYDESLIEAVRIRYQKDIDYFGFTFQENLDR